RGRAGAGRPLVVAGRLLAFALVSSSPPLAGRGLAAVVLRLAVRAARMLASAVPLRAAVGRRAATAAPDGLRLAECVRLRLRLRRRARGRRVDGVAAVLLDVAAAGAALGARRGVRVLPGVVASRVGLIGRLRHVAAVLVTAAAAACDGLALTQGV